MNDIGRDIVAADTRHVWHPYTQHWGMAPPVEVVSAKGVYLHTADGRSIIDAISSWWVTLHGHAQPEIADAIAKQTHTLDQVIFATFTHEPAALLAQELVARLPAELQRVFFSDDGSTAVEVAVKMALQYHANLNPSSGSKRRVIAALEHAYHGDTFGAMSVSARSLFTAPFASELFDVHRLPDPTEGDAVLALEQLLDERAQEVAAVIVEPLLLGTGGMRMYSPKVLQTMRHLTRTHDVLLIADEVLTGFGRLGPLFACELAEISPDIICLSKGITGGMLPLGATVATDAVFEAFLSDDRHRTLFHGHSYTANPMACAAARASLHLLDDASARHRAMIEAVHITWLERLAEHPLVTRPRHLGTIAAFDLRGGEGYLTPIGRTLAAFALQHDVLLRPLGDVVYIMPPYCISADELHHVYSVIEQFLTHQ